MAVQDPIAVEPVIAPSSGITPEVQRELDMLRARVDFPLADQEILQLVHGTPEQIRSAAKSLHEKAEAATRAAVPAPALADPANASPAGGGPVPIPGAGQITPPEHVSNARYDELLQKVELKSANELERQEFFMMSLRGDNGIQGWNAHVEKLKQRPGRS